MTTGVLEPDLKHRRLQSVSWACVALVAVGAVIVRQRIHQRRLAHNVTISPFQEDRSAKWEADEIKIFLRQPTGYGQVDLRKDARGHLDQMVLWTGQTVIRIKHLADMEVQNKRALSIDGSRYATMSSYSQCIASAEMFLRFSRGLSDRISAKPNARNTACELHQLALELQWVAVGQDTADIPQLQKQADLCASGLDNLHKWLKSPQGRESLHPADKMPASANAASRAGFQ